MLVIGFFDVLIIAAVMCAFSIPRGRQLAHADHDFVCSREFFSPVTLTWALFVGFFIACVLERAPGVKFLIGKIDGPFPPYVAWALLLAGWTMAAAIRVMAIRIGYGRR